VKKLKNRVFLILILSLSFYLFAENEINLPYEYSLDEFQKGIRAYHNCLYEMAIVNFTKSLSFYNDADLSRYYLGDSYRKAGYERNALFEWNSLLSKGYKERELKSKISHLYNKRGMIDEIFVNKGYLLREDIKGYIDEKSAPLFIKPAQIAVDKNNHYYITSFLDGRTIELDSNLNLVKNNISFTHKIEKPYGVAVDNEGYVYVSDFKNDVVVKFNQLGLVEKIIGFKGSGEGGLLGPKYLLFDDENSLYVADSGNKRVNKYKSNGDILFSFGNKKESDGVLASPNGLMFYKNSIYVCDRDNDRVVCYDKSGNYQFSLGEDKLKKPYDIAVDNLGRMLILCEKNIWVYEEDNGLWYVVDALGDRLERGASIKTDVNNNILITDYNSSRLFILSQDRDRYTNFSVNIERVFANNFPEVHLAVSVEKDDFTNPVGINWTNFTLYENGRMIPVVGSSYTQTRDEINDVVIVHDKNENMKKYTSDFKNILDKWFRNKKSGTSVSYISIREDDATIENELNSTRLSVLESLENRDYSKRTDKGYGIKTAIYSAIGRFSKKSIILVTNSKETGRDFEKFKFEDALSLAKNSDIAIYIVSFEENSLSNLYRYMAKETGGEYLRAYHTSDIEKLITKIEERKGKEIILSYRSRAVSRFGEEPIKIYMDVDFNGVNGSAESVYYPPKIR